MAIPLSYNVRNLMVRRTTTLMTALGIGLTVAVLASVLALSEGLEQSFAASGHPLQALVMRKGGNAELSSIMPRQAFNEVIRTQPGLQRTPAGEPMASLEVVTVVAVPGENNPDGENATVRGLAPVGLAMREEAKLTAGRWFTPGKREITVGSHFAKGFPAAAVGQSLTFGRGKWEVVGIFHSTMPSRNSELWADANQMGSDFNRLDFLSSALVRATDEVALQSVMNRLSADKRLETDVQLETAYYAKQTESGAVIKFLGIFVAIIMAIGSCFAAMNTMYAAVARRSKEIGTLRILGFSRRAILGSFFVEALLLSALGGVLGLALVVPLNGFTSSVGSTTTFSQMAFALRITPKVVMAGMSFALVMGVLGGLLPAFNAARKQILTALRQV